MFRSLRRLVTSNGGQHYARDRSWVFVGLTEEPNSFGFAYITLLEERKPGLDEKTIINDIVKLIYVLHNDLPDQ